MDDVFGSRSAELIEGTKIGRIIDEQTIKASLETYPIFFKNFNYDDAFFLFQKMQPKFYINGDYVLKSSKHSNGIYIIARGTVAVCHPKSHNTILCSLGEGSYFGEKFILKAGMVGVRQYDYKVISANAKILEIDEKIVSKVLKKDLEMKARFYSLACLRWVNFFNHEMEAHCFQRSKIANLIKRIKNTKNGIDKDKNCKPESIQRFTFDGDLNFDSINLEHKIFEVIEHDNLCKFYC